jgi:hypothetical protein
MERGAEMLLPGPRHGEVQVSFEREDEVLTALLERVGVSTLLHSIARVEKSGGFPASVGL